MAHRRPYTKEIERDLIRRALKGDEPAYEKVIGHYEKRIQYLARRLRQEPGQIKDLVSEGCIALMERMETFDPAKGFWLWAHARHRVWWKMQAYLRDKEALVSFSSEAKKKRKEINKTWEELSHRHARAPSAEEVAEVLALEENPDFALLEEKKQKDILERTVKIVREVLYGEMHSLDEDTIADLPPEDLGETYAGSGSKSALPVDRMKEFHRRVHTCLKDPVRARKWLILVALRRGDDLHMRKKWDMIADDLRDPDAAIGKPIGTEPSVWRRLRRFHVLEDEAPERWKEVYELFRYAKDRGRKVRPPLHYVTATMEPAEVAKARGTSDQNLRKFLSRVNRKLHQCYPDGLFPE